MQAPKATTVSPSPAWSGDPKAAKPGDTVTLTSRSLRLLRRA